VSDETRQLLWQKSTRCGSGACVEVAKESGKAVYLRDSKDPDGPAIALTRDEWILFLRAAKAGDYDRVVE